MTFDAEIERPRRGVWFRAKAVYPGEMPLKPRAAQRTQCAGAWPPTGSAANKTWIGRVALYEPGRKDLGLSTQSEGGLL